MSDTADLARYARQMRYAPLGEEGQRRLRSSSVLLCGCGALGSVLANTLVRAGVGRLRLVDRDFVDLTNLQRQVLYTEDDVQAGLPKAVAATEQLKRINSQVILEPHVADVDHRNLQGLLDGIDLILDGTDNFDTRFLLNDAAIKWNLPWVYGGCIGAEGQTMTIVPGRTPCFRCLMRETPPPGSTATCDTAGILGPVVNVVASYQACEALKILSGNLDAISRYLTVFEMWDNRVRQIKLDSLAGGDCPTCNHREFPWLMGERGSHTAVLCGRNAVQLSFPGHEPISLESLAEKLATVGRVARNPFLVRLEVDGLQLSIFADGRAIVNGTEDIARARTVYARYIGS